MSKKFFSFVMLMILSAPAFALLTVHQTDPTADFTNITDALTSATTGEEVRVLDQAVYTESFILTDVVLRAVPSGAELTGGTIQFDGGTSATLDGFIMDNNVNAIFINNGTANITNCTISNNDNHGILFNSAEDSVANITNCTLEGNANAITFFRNATVTLTNSTISNSTSHAVWMDGSLSNATGFNLTLDNSTISGTQANNALTCYRPATISLLNGSSLSGNAGAGIMCDFEAGYTITINDSQITGSASNGLALYRACEVNMNNATIANNGGAGMYMDDFSGQTGFPGQVTIVDSQITGNGGKGLQGVAKGTSDVWTIRGCTVSGNGDRAVSLEATPANSTNILATIEKNIFNDGTSNAQWNVTVFDAAAGSKIVNNLIDQGATGIAAGRGAQIDIYHNTIVNNGSAGTGIDIDDPQDNNVNIVNNIIDGVDTAFASLGTGLAATQIDYNLINATTVGDASVSALLGSNNILNGDADFAAASATVGAGDYHVGEFSDAVNAGDATLGVADDLLGQARPNPAGTAPDMGAYEDQVFVPVELSGFELE